MVPIIPFRSGGIAMKTSTSRISDEEEPLEIIDWVNEAEWINHDELYTQYMTEGWADEGFNYKSLLAKAIAIDSCIFDMLAGKKP